jgi:hypothetical protein
MDYRTTEQLLLDREIARLAIRIDRLRYSHNRKILIAKIERLLLREPLRLNGS